MVGRVAGGPPEAIHNMLGCWKVRIPYTEADNIHTFGLYLLFEAIELGKQVWRQKGQSCRSLELHLTGKTSEKTEFSGKLTYFVGLRNFPPSISAQSRAKPSTALREAVLTKLNLRCWLARPKKDRPTGKGQCGRVRKANTQRQDDSSRNR